MHNIAKKKEMDATNFYHLLADGWFMLLVLYLLLLDICVPAQKACLQQVSKQSKSTITHNKRFNESSTSKNPKNQDIKNKNKDNSCSTYQDQLDMYNPKLQLTI